LQGLPSLDDPASVKRKAELEETVRAAFNARQKAQSYEVDRLRQRLAQIESRLTMRERAEKEIVRQRVEELLHPERSWEPGDRASESPSTLESAAGTTKKNSPNPSNAAAGPAQDIWMTDMAAARAEAEKAGRLLLLYFRPKPSANQQKHEMELAGSPSVQKVLRHFVLVAVDTSDAANGQVMGEYRIGAKPKVVVTDADGQPRYATEKDSFRDRWQLDELRQDLTGVLQRYQSEQAASANETGRPATISSDSARSGKYGAAVFPADGKNPREAVLDADFAHAAALAAVAAAEKGRDFSKSELKRTQDLFQKGAISESAVRTLERKASEDDARLDKAKLDLEHAERLAKLARENLQSRVKLLELDMVDAKLRVEHLTQEEARARRLNESKAMSRAEYDESKLALERAKLQLSRLTELMELFTKPIPGDQRTPAGDVKEDVPESGSRKGRDGAATSAELSVGHFSFSNGTAQPRAVIHVDFKLAVVTSTQHAFSLETQIKAHTAEIREAVDKVVSSSNLEELNDPSLGTIKRSIRKEINRQLGTNYVNEVVISDARIIEQ
jgi:hypothetical protein